MTDLTPQQVIAQVLHHIEDEGHTDETALSSADDVIHALRVAGHVIVAAGDVSTALDVLDDYFADGRVDEATIRRREDASDRLHAALRTPTDDKEGTGR